MLHFEMPLVIGWDVSDIIKEIGANVTELEVGMKYSVVRILHDEAHMPNTSRSMRISSSKTNFTEFRGGRITSARRPYGMASHVRSDGCRIFIRAGTGGTVAIQLAKAHELYVGIICRHVDEYAERGLGQKPGSRRGHRL